MNKYSHLIEALQGYEAFKGKILENEPIAPKTTFKIGGAAQLFIAPQNYYSFQIVLNVLNFYKLPLLKKSSFIIWKPNI